MGESVTEGCGRGFAFATGFPETLYSKLSRDIVSDVSVTYLSIPFTIRKNVLDENRPSHPRQGRFRVSEIHPLTGDASSLRGNVYSRHRFFISSGLSSLSSVMKNCPFSTIFKPASEHSLDNLWSSRNCSNLCSFSCSRFTCNSALV